MQMVDASWNGRMPPGAEQVVLSEAALPDVSHAVAAIRAITYVGGPECLKVLPRITAKRTGTDIGEAAAAALAAIERRLAAESARHTLVRGSTASTHGLLRPAAEPEGKVEELVIPVKKAT